ncbi:MAG: RHS repeat protein, partial [Rhodococcus sp.]|nr:RHS repeat protein [Rhodococcus sp. (in: high G+C Gram-positive bacteria)]
DVSENTENPGQQELADGDSGVREAADEAGCDANQTSNQICEGGDPVDVATGEFLLPETDLTLPGVLPLTFGRRHRSSYRFGRWFGPSWSATVDMRIVVEESGVTLLAEDGVMLTYAHPQVGTPTLPASGQLWPLSRTDSGGYRVHNPDRNITWHFAPKPELDGLDAALGNLSISAITDRHRNRIRFHYDADGAPTEISHSGGYRVLLDTRAGRITALSVVDGDTATPVRQFAYTGGHLTAVTNGVGGTTRYTYDDAGRMLTWVDDNGNQMVNTYDEAGRVVVQRGTAGIMDCRFNYDSNSDTAGRTTVVTDSMGAPTAHGFDNDLRLRDLLDPSGGHTHTDYNSRREPLRVVTPDGAVTRYLYTDNGDVARIIRPDGNAVSIDYAGPHRPSTIRSADGSTTRQEWDKAGNLVAVTDAAGARTQYSYHPNGTVASVTGPTGATTFIECDNAGLPATITDPLGTVTRIVRDGFGRPESVIDPTGATTGYRWSADGQLLAQTHPDGTSEIWVYDGEGNLLAHTDTGGGVTGYEYGDFDLLAARTDPDGSVTSYLWDTERRLIAVTNPLGATWSYQYDGAGRLVAETDFIGATTTYTHDASGRVASVTPATGVARRNTYDVLGRLTDIRTDSGEHLRFDHDLAGRVTTAVTGHGDNTIHTVDFDYTATGQLAAQAVDGHPEMRFEHDLAGRRIRRLSPSGGDTAWQWDPAGQLSGLTTDGHRVSFDHDPRGALSGWRIGELDVSRQHTVRGQLAAQTVTAHPASSLNFDFDGPSQPPQIMREDAYAYRPDGYLTNHTTTSDAAAVVDRVLSRDYTLDPAGRITTVAHNGNLAEQFGYDRLGNITNSTVVDTADASDRREYLGNLLIRDGRTRYHYDEAGRLVRKTTTRLSHGPDVWHYRYNAFDQLVEVTTPDGQRWHYTYDALGRRTTKARVSESGESEELTRYTWDGTTLLEQTDSGTTTRWNYQPGTHTPITQASSQGDVDTEFYAIITDLVGTPVQLIEPDSADSAGTATADLWGRTTWQGVDTPLRFPGQYHDDETGLHYNLHRYYNPSTARYNTQDPLGLAPSPNPNTYPHNPTGWTDPLGLVPKPCEVVDRPAHDHSFDYHPRIRERGLEDPTGHNFPYSFDDVILGNDPIVQRDGSLLYRADGYLHGKSGYYEIAVNVDRNLIFHRTWRSAS